MHLIGWEYSVFRVRAQQYAQNEISFQQLASDFRGAMKQMRSVLADKQADPFLANGVKDILRTEL